MRMPGRLPGQERVRIERVHPQQYRVPSAPKTRRDRPAALVMIYGFAAMIAVGTVVLMLPISGAAGQWTPLADALFTATSAVCVTGLVVVDTGTYWSGFGQVVIVVLIQAGGFGFMTSSTLLLLLVIRRRTRLRDRVLVQESIGRGELGDVTGVVKRVALFTLVAELAGAVVLTAALVGRGVDALGAIGLGAFHSISAFNNAGFDLMGALGSPSLTAFVGDYGVLGTHAVLIVVGGLGYAIVDDVVRKWRWQRFALETKVVLVATGATLLAGAIAIAALEWNNPGTLGSLPEDQRILNAVFESVTARTAGFNAIDTAALLAPAAGVVMALMFIGGASGSTAGGIKVNTFSLLLIAIVSTARGKPSAEAFGRRVEHIVVYRALSVALLSIAIVFSMLLALATLSGEPSLDILFEAVSAFGTVGMSRGITAGLSDAGQFVLILAMFVGRLGPLTLVLGLTARARPVAFRPAVEEIRIG